MKPGSEGTQPVSIPVVGARLRGDLTLPERAIGVVAFAHGTGSSRHSPRNRLVAERLNQAGLATLLLDLLTEEEELADLQTRELRFDIPLLAGRFTTALEWLSGQEPTGSLALGCFGASTGAAAALIAAQRRPDLVGAVVSRGGRPDLAGPALSAVTAPTLLIVGGNDAAVLELNRRARGQMRCLSELEVVPGASHLFEEPGALDAVAELARRWFVRHLTGDPDGRGH